MNGLRFGTLHAIVLSFLCVLSPAIHADISGRVFVVETNEGVAGASVTNGRDITYTDATGKYELPEYGDFVYLTRTEDLDPVEWFKPVTSLSLDFRVSSKAISPETIFFIQMSDTHVYDRKSDFLEFSAPSIPWFLPDFLVPWITVRLLENMYGEDVSDKLRATLLTLGYDGELDDLSDAETYSLYVEQQNQAQSIFKPLDQQIENALAEVGGFVPDFVINTGDLVLESNNGSPEAIDRWFKYYLELTKALPVRIYNTIGNNEIAGTEREEFEPVDPRFGKFFFKSYLGPTHFSFDRGDFHFIATDTHSPDPQDDNPDYWNFGKMTPDIQQWFVNELEANKDKTVVVLNHEPFHFDDLWPFDNDQHVDDQGLFSKFGVDYVLTGHTHFKSAMKIDGVHHLTAGALSGMRWVLPATVHERGYRLFLGYQSELYSAWKETGKPFVGLSEPQPSDAATTVVVVADAAGAFEKVEFFSGDTKIPAVKLRDYFYQIASADIGAEGVRVETSSADGTVNSLIVQ